MVDKTSQISSQFAATTREIRSDSNGTTLDNAIDKLKELSEKATGSEKTKIEKEIATLKQQKTDAEKKAHDEKMGKSVFETAKDSKKSKET